MSSDSGGGLLPARAGSSASQHSSTSRRRPRAAAAPHVLARPGVPPPAPPSSSLPPPPTSSLTYHTSSASVTSSTSSSQGSVLFLKPMKNLRAGEQSEGCHLNIKRCRRQWGLPRTPTPFQLYNDDLRLGFLLLILLCSNWKRLPEEYLVQRHITY
jgi:hypothetical protein